MSLPRLKAFAIQPRTLAQKQIATARRAANYRLQDLRIKLLIAQLDVVGIDEEPEREGKVSASRRWRVDLVWPQFRVACEIEGVNGRHQSIGGFIGDCEKYNELAAQGYLLIRATHHHIADGSAADCIARAIRSREGEGVCPR